MNMALSSITAILLENLRPLLWPAIAILVLELALLLRLRRAPRPLPVAAGLRLAASVGLLAAIIVAVVAPAVTLADFSALSGWLDWGFLVAVALLAGILTTLLLWLPAVWLRRARS